MASSSAFQPRIFISHSSADTDFCIKLAQDLRHYLSDDDSAVWYDAQGLKGGDAWWRTITEEIRYRNVFIVILSPDAADSKWVNAEVDMAWRQMHSQSEPDKLIIPVLYRPSKIRDDLEILQCVSFLSIKDYEQAFQALCVALKPTKKRIAPTLPAPLQHTNRRVIIVGLVATVATAVAGAEIVSKLTRTQKSSGLPALSATPFPIGYTYYTYYGHAKSKGQLGVISIVWSPDGQYIASSGDYMQVWNVKTSESSYTYYSSAEATGSLAWSPDGKYIAVVAGKTVDVLNAKTGKRNLTYHGHTSYTGNNAVFTISWSPDSKRIASAGSLDGTVQVWNALTGEKFYTYPGENHPYQVIDVAWSPDGKYLASVETEGGGSSVQIWGANAGNHLYTNRYDVTYFPWESVTWSPDSQRVAAAGKGDGTADVWDAATGNHLQRYYAPSSGYLSVVWSPTPKSTRVASSGIHNTIHLWDALTLKTVYIYEGHTASVHAVAWSPNGTRIASGGEDRTVQIWQAI